MRRTFFLAVVSLLWALSAFAQTAPKAQSRFTTLDGVKVHYDNYGRGKEAIVFIHGWTCDATFWRANLPAFTEAMRVIAVDLPGHGQSDKPEKLVYSMDLFANAVNAVLLHAKVERAVLVGHSMGTPVIRQFYRKYPAKVQALVIVDGSLKAMGTKESMKQFLDPFREPGYKQHAEQMITYLTQAMKNEQTRNEVKAAMLSAPQYVMISAFDGMLDPEIWKTQDKINVPTLALMAANPQWSADYEKFVRELVPNLDYQTWLGVSHFLMMDEPNKFNGTVMTFLKRNKIIQ